AQSLDLGNFEVDDAARFVEIVHAPRC
ncbi:MAG: hypothetical protein JWQ44_1549, partial [Chthoniobacter sp.]|nr:hypothetical protein [Chthoniobacter sp.]